jgi:hypothetical protein
MLDGSAASREGADALQPFGPAARQDLAVEMPPERSSRRKEADAVEIGSF